MVTGDEVQVTWFITPAHYLYKERMGYASASPAVALGEAVLPDGKPYDDEFFGPMEIYRKQAVIRIPIESISDNASEFDLEIRSQGCADIGCAIRPRSG